MLLSLAIIWLLISHSLSHDAARPKSLSKIVGSDSKYYSCCSRYLLGFERLFSVFTTKGARPLFYSGKIQSSKVDMNSKLSSIDKLLGTNKVPSYEQKCLIQNKLIGPETKLLEIRTQIAKIREQLENLTRKETILAQEIAPYQALISPFRRLPDDILREILLACLPSGYVPVIDFRRPPLLLTQISSRLRQVAFTTPRLWAAIDVPILVPCLTEWFDGRDKSRVSYCQRIMAKYAWAVNEWLCRAGACGVEIFVHEKGNNVANWYIEDIFKLLIARAPQWKSISLRCSAYSVQRFCEILGQSYSKEFNFPQLEHLSLDISGLDYQQDDPQEEYNHTSHLPDAFRLNSIHLVTPADNYEGYRIQWPRLTYLSLGSAKYPSSLNSIVNTLESCAGLLSCKLHIRMDDTHLRICLPHLKAISIFFDQEAWFGNIYENTPYSRQMENAFSLFDRLDTPMLERITYDASAEFMPLLGLVHRMGNRITHLSVTNFEVPTELIECLKECPLLVSLDVSRQGGIPSSPTRNSQWRRLPALSASLVLWSTAGGQLLRYLMTADDIDETIREQLCPRLEHLAYHIVDGPISCEAIEAFILNKCNAQEGTCAGLKGFSVYVRGGEQDIMNIRDSVELQVLAGLRLQLIPGRIAPKLTSID